MEDARKRARTDAGPRSPSDFPPPRLRFQKTDRVLCKISGRWAAGAIASVNEDDPEDPTGQSKVPYVVRLDPPIGRLIAVPVDDSNVCAVEVCWGQKQTSPAQAARAGALWWTLFSLPTFQPKTRRFAVGDRVACAVEDDTDQLSLWAPGTVQEVDISLEADASRVLPQLSWAGIANRVPYRVQLDSGCQVIACMRAPRACVNVQSSVTRNEVHC